MIETGFNPLGREGHGGIKEENVQEVWRAGADSVAIISDILGANDVTAKTKRILALHAAPR